MTLFLLISYLLRQNKNDNEPISEPAIDIDDEFVGDTIFAQFELVNKGGKQVVKKIVEIS